MAKRGKVRRMYTSQALYNKTEVENRKDVSIGMTEHAVLFTF